MVLPMPTEVTNTIHELAAVRKKYNRVVYTDKEGNIIKNNNYDDTSPSEGHYSPSEVNYNH